MFGLLLTFFYIPLLVVYSDPTSGLQKQYQWLWYLVGFSCLGVYVLYVSFKLWKAFRRDKVKKEKEAETNLREAEDVATRPIETWTTDEVSLWIKHCEELKANSKLTDDDLESISEKMKDAKVDGELLLVVCKSQERLEKSVMLPLGDACRFSSAMENLFKRRSILSKNDVYHSAPEQPLADSSPAGVFDV